jgi:hypothetical protein
VTPESPVAQTSDLRAADWRFLLGSWRFRRILCLPGSSPGQSAAAVADEVVAPPVPDGSCDLVLARDPTPAAVAVAHRALGPGGQFHATWTWKARSRGLPLERRLAEAGFTDILTYWPWPPDAPQIRVPLRRAAASAMFLDLQAAPGSLRRRLRAELRRRAWNALRRLDLLSPVQTVAGIRAVADEPALSALEAVTVGLLDASPAALLLRTPGFRESNRVIGLVFLGKGSEDQVVVVKTVRDQRWSAALGREAANLVAAAHASPGLSGVPRVLGRSSLGGTDALVESHVGGTPMHHLVGHAPDARLAVLAIDWLARFARLTRRAPTMAWRGTAERVLEQFESDFGDVVRPELLALTRRRLDGLGPLPTVFEHRDFAPWNLVVDGHDLGVHDWESAEPDGIPALDPVYFMTYLALLRHRATEPPAAREAYRRAWGTRSLGAAMLRRYASAVGLPPDAARVLRLLVWPLHAASEFRRSCEDAGGARPPMETLRRSLFLALWEEEAVAQA